jgi:predicted nuclease with TOPRIM domain
MHVVLALTLSRIQGHETLVKRYDTATSCLQESQRKNKELQMRLDDAEQTHAVFVMQNNKELKKYNEQRDEFIQKAGMEKLKYNFEIESLRKELVEKNGIIKELKKASGKYLILLI